MYDIPTAFTRREVAKNLKQAQTLVDNAIKFLEAARALAPDEVYLGYDVSDRIYNCRRLASDIGEHVSQATEVGDAS